jgi:hypothetical protein
MMAEIIAWCGRRRVRAQAVEIVPWSPFNAARLGQVAGIDGFCHGVSAANGEGDADSTPAQATRVKNSL